VFFAARITIFAMFKDAVLTVAGVFLLLACNAHGIAPHRDLTSLQQEGVIRFFYPSAGGTVEAYVTRPRGTGPSL
jgi:hypothetical protein